MKICCLLSYYVDTIGYYLVEIVFPEVAGYSKQRGIVLNLIHLRKSQLAI